MTDPSQCIGIGGNSIGYFNAASINTTDDTVTIANHGLNTRDKVYVQEISSATRFGLTPIGPIASVTIGDGGTGYTDGTYQNVALTGGTGEDATADLVVASGAITTVTIVSAGSNYTAADSLTASTLDLGGTSTTPVAITVSTITAGAVPFTALFAIRVNEHTLQLASY